jgi:hypothetical protein
MSFAYVLLALNLIASRQAPAGAQLHIRLTAPISSYGSRAGDPISAVLIAPVVFTSGIAASASGEQIILPPGSLVSGTLKSVQRVGLGIIHENAALDLEFNHVTLPNGDRLPLSSRVQVVDTGRERVTRDGSIRGVRPTGSLSYRAGGYIRTALQWEVHAAIAAWAIRTLLVQVPEPELYYPAGVELTLALTQPLFAPLADAPVAVAEAWSGPERARMDAVVAAMPLRTHTFNLNRPARNRPSDLTNLLFIGSREDLTAAFEAAGWTPPDSANLRTNIRRIRAVADGRGDTAAPMSMLLVEDTKPDMAWQKGFNDVSKRHHIRIWKQPETWRGRETWIAAATRDVDFAYLRPGRAMTHKIDENIDEERDKVVNDLVFTSCVDLVDWSERMDLPTFSRNATGDPMHTDTRLAIVGLHDCRAPQYMSQGDSPALRLRGSGIQRFTRREILSLRSDLLRENLYWRSYEGIRWMVAAIRGRRERTEDDRPAYPSTYELGLSSRRSRAVREMLQ